MIDRAWNQHEAVGTGLGCLLGKRGAIAGCRFIDGEKHRLALGNTLRRFQHREFFLVAEHRAFAERTRNNQTIATRIHQEREATFHFLVIEFIIFSEFGCNRRENA